MSRILAILLCGTVLFPFQAWAASDYQILHALTVHGAAKYPADFKHFDYVRPDAPKGGVLRSGTVGTFNSFHPYIAKGDAVSTGSIESLLQTSVDEPLTAYCLLAEQIELANDRSWVAFKIRPEARWHDGMPVTVEDVIWSFKVLTSKGAPHYRYFYRGVKRVEKLAADKVIFHFTNGDNRELPLIVGELPILPKHYWADKDFSKTTLEPPLGSGPYRVADFESGRSLILERVKNYWGWHLPIKQGIHNFDRIQTLYFRDDTAIRLALKSGQLDYRLENQAKAWALDYAVPAVENGKLIKKLVRHRQPTGMQAFVFNTRRPPFDDVRIRKALNHAFDFNWVNHRLFFNQYTRTSSYFSNSELASSGIPKGLELEILQEYDEQLPPEIFTTAYETIETDGSGWPRKNLRRAFALLAEAGWVVRNMRLVHAETNNPFNFTILLVNKGFERIMLPFIRNLERLGIEARISLVDQSQYVNRLRQFDFDMTVMVWGQSDSPGNEQRNYWGSSAADTPGSRNFIGVKEPVVDALVVKIVNAQSREALIARTRALDRVLLHQHYVIPNWHIREDRVLYWDKFSYPDIPVKVGVYLDRWWFDPRKAARLSAGKEAF